MKRISMSKRSVNKKLFQEWLFFLSLALVVLNKMSINPG